MTQCNTLDVKLSNSLLNKLKSGTKNSTEVTSKLLSNVTGDSELQSFVKFLQIILQLT